MTNLIDKDALVAEIEKKLADILACRKDASTPDERIVLTNMLRLCEEILSFLDTLEVKEVDNELQEIEKKVTEGFIERVNKKRIPISLKGEKKAKFKNEFNTLWQTIDGVQFANVAKYIIERLCLHFAAWGAYNLKDYCSISPEEKHKMDLEVKEVDLEKEVNAYMVNEMKFLSDEVGYDTLSTIAKHFFELGLKAQKGE